MSQYTNKEAAEELDDDSDDEDFKPEGEESDNDNNLKLEKEENDVETNDDNLVFSKKRRSGILDTANKKSKITQASEKTEDNSTNENVKSKVLDIWEQMKAESLPVTKNEPTLSSTQSTTPSTSITPQQSTTVASNAPKVKTVTQTYDFAGETVKVTKPVSSPVQAKSKPKGNLDDLLGGMKKKKMSTMEKSQLDWQKFKSNEGLNDELKQATKGGGYLDKQAFLQRTEWRQYEKERDIRLASINKKPQ